MQNFSFVKFLRDLSAAVNQGNFLRNTLTILLSTLGILMGSETFLPSVSAQVRSSPFTLLRLNTGNEGPNLYFDFSEKIFLQKTVDGCVPGKFVHVGRGGLPPRPTDILTSPSIWHDIRRLPRPLKKVEQYKPHINTITKAELPIEAQGWQIQADKKLSLVMPNSKSEFSALNGTSTC